MLMVSINNSQELLKQPLDYSARANVVDYTSPVKSGLNVDVIPMLEVGPFTQIAIQPISNDFVGQLASQVSNDGVNWVTVWMVKNTDWEPFLSISTDVNTHGYMCQLAFKYYRLRILEYTSGSISCAVRFSTATNPGLASF